MAADFFPSRNTVQGHVWWTKYSGKTGVWVRKEESHNSHFYCFKSFRRQNRRFALNLAAKMRNVHCISCQLWFSMSGWCRNSQICLSVRCRWALTRSYRGALQLISCPAAGQSFGCRSLPSALPVSAPVSMHAQGFLASTAEECSSEESRFTTCLLLSAHRKYQEESEGTLRDTVGML